MHPLSCCAQTRVLMRTVWSFSLEADEAVINPNTLIVTYHHYSYCIASSEVKPINGIVLARQARNSFCCIRRVLSPLAGHRQGLGKLHFIGCPNLIWIRLWWESSSSLYTHVWVAHDCSQMCMKTQCCSCPSYFQGDTERPARHARQKQHQSRRAGQELLHSASHLCQRWPSFLGWGYVIHGNFQWPIRRWISLFWVSQLPMLRRSSSGSSALHESSPEIGSAHRILCNFSRACTWSRHPIGLACQKA